MFDVKDRPCHVFSVILLAVSDPIELWSSVVLADCKLCICEQVIAEQAPLQSAVGDIFHHFDE